MTRSQSTAWASAVRVASQGREVVPGLLVHQVEERLAELGRALGRAVRHRALDLGGGLDGLPDGVNTPPRHVRGPLGGLAGSRGGLVGGALAHLDDGVGRVLGGVGGLLGAGAGDLRHRGFPVAGGRHGWPARQALSAARQYGM
jgi:hypothetical protein